MSKQLDEYHSRLKEVLNEAGKLTETDLEYCKLLTKKESKANADAFICWMPQCRNKAEKENIFCKQHSEKKSCDHACSPSDWREGGKCDRMGCYDK